MSKAPRYPKLTTIVIIEFHGNVPTEGRTAIPDIHCNIQNASLGDADQLALAHRVLEMKPPQHATARS